eukprot:SAG31_NODE_5473_length_2519_cov_1.478099_4_plen_175_part_00
MDIIFCKSSHCVELMKQFRQKHARTMNFKIYYTNHTSQDMKQVLIHAAEHKTAPYKRFLHVAGKSIFKNTETVLRCWNANPTFPRLKVIIWGQILRRVQMVHPDWFNEEGRPIGWSNVDFITERVPDDQMKAILNQCAPYLHICIVYCLLTPLNCQTQHPCVPEFTGRFRALYQ